MQSVSSYAKAWFDRLMFCFSAFDAQSTYTQTLLDPLYLALNALQGLRNIGRHSSMFLRANASGKGDRWECRKVLTSPQKVSGSCGSFAEHQRAHLGLYAGTLSPWRILPLRSSEKLHPFSVSSRVLTLVKVRVPSHRACACACGGVDVGVDAKGVDGGVDANSPAEASVPGATNRMIGMVMHVTARALLACYTRYTTRRLHVANTCCVMMH